MAKEHFYMVYAEGGNVPVCRHITIESAEAEAQRLAEKLNTRTYVLASIKSFTLRKFDVEDCRPTDDLPF